MLLSSKRLIHAYLVIPTYGGELKIWGTLRRNAENIQPIQFFPNIKKLDNFPVVISRKSNHSGTGHTRFTSFAAVQLSRCVTLWT